MIKILIFVVAVSGAVSCQSLGPLALREPNAFVESNANGVDLELLYKGQLELSRLANKLMILERRIWEIQNAQATETNRNLLKQLSSEKDELRARVSALRQSNEALEFRIAQANPSSLPSRKIIRAPGEWRTHVETFNIGRIERFAFDGDQPTATLTIDSDQAAQVRVQLKSTYYSAPEKKLKVKVEERAALQMQVSCDVNYEFREALVTRSYRAGKPVQFQLFDSEGNGQSAFLQLKTPFQECVLTWYAPDSKLRYGVRLVPDEKALGPLARLARETEACLLPDTKNLAGPERFFLNSKFTSFTCPTHLENLRTLEDPEQALIAKMEAMTGSTFPRDAIAKLDPFVPLDFSRAPQLDLIVVSYLVFHSDFFGQMIARGLKWHADRGAQVRILTSDVAQVSKDRAMLNTLVASSPNIKMQEYRYKPSKGEGIEGWLNRLHRVTHVKIFATHSEHDERANVTIIGGRNIHDGFLFRQAPDHSRFPELVNYGGGEQRFTHWRDFEVVFQGRDINERIISHFLTYWYREPSTFFRSVNLSLNTGAPLKSGYFEQAESKPLVRHLISIPFVDDGKLMDFYADLMDSAQTKIKISTPYLRLTDKLADALQRALDRKVEVTLLTRINLDNDTAAGLVSAVNKSSVNQFWRKIKLFEYTEPKVILHSKLVIIDDRLTFVGSVNLNKRSFYHDTENGILIYSKKVNRQIERVYDSYMNLSSQVDKDQEMSRFWMTIIGLVDKEI